MYVIFANPQFWSSCFLSATIYAQEAHRGWMYNKVYDVAIARLKEADAEQNYRFEP